MERQLLLENLPQVTFDDAAIYFSEEQWRNLEDFQKKIYKELIKEIYETMLALGYRIPKPEIVSRIERGEEPCIDSSKKPKMDASQAEGSKDGDPAVKVERNSPEASAPLPPGEISSSQERSAVPCPRCGTCCNNQCGTGYQWSAPGVYPGDGNHRKTYVPPSPTFFNGTPVSPGYAGRTDAMTHPTSPYGNIGMVPLSPHYPLYRNMGDPHTTFPFPERPPNPMYPNFDLSQPMGPPGSHMTGSDHESRVRKDPPYLHPRDGPFQERRNPMGPPCPACGTFCNNQCGANFQWEQRRLHHAVPGAMETSRYPSPGNPYFGANPPAFPNGRHPLRHSTPPVNVQGGPPMIQLSPQFAGYRRSGDPKSPNVLHGKPEIPPGHGGNTSGAGLHGPSQGGKYGAIPASIGGNHRKAQSMSPLAALETMPMMSTNNSPSSATELRSRPSHQVPHSSPSAGADQRSRNPNSGPNATAEPRSRPSAPTVTSSDGSRGPLSTHYKRPEHTHSSVRVVRSLSPPSQPRLSDVTFNKHPHPAHVGLHASKNIQPSSTFSQDPAGNKRSALQQPSGDSGGPPKRASPTVIIVDCDEGKPASPPLTITHVRGGAGETPPTSRSDPLPSEPIVVDDGLDPGTDELQEARDGKRLPITISNIRTSGIFNPPVIRGKKDPKNDPGPIIIIDDKEPEARHPPPGKTSKEESRGSAAGTPPVKNTKAAGEPPLLAPKIHPQQGAPVLVQQPPPIIVASGNNLVNPPVCSNQSIMLTFPVTVASSGIVLATPVSLQSPISGVSPSGRVPISKKPRLLPNPAPLNVTPGNVGSKLGPLAVRPAIAPANRLPLPPPHGQAMPIAVSQPGGTLSHPNLQKVTSAGSQPIPLYVDPNSGLILTGATVPSKEAVAPVISNATVVGNVGPVGGKLAFSPVNGLGNATFIAVDAPVGIANNSSVAGNPPAMSNPTILTLNGGLGLGGAHPVGAPIANISSSSLQAAPNPSAGGQHNSGIVIRKVGEPGSVLQNPQTCNDSPLVVVERLFNCSECGEKFNSLENLTSHQLAHKRPTAEGGASEATSKNNEVLPGGGDDDDAPTILYTTQGDDGSTVYVVTV